MGTEIIRQISGHGNSRLWLENDAEYVLSEHTVRTSFYLSF